jgi:hypothetical protein
MQGLIKRQFYSYEFIFTKKSVSCSKSNIILCYIPSKNFLFSLANIQILKQKRV